MTEFRKVIDDNPPPRDTPHVWGVLGFRHTVELGFGVGVGLLCLGLVLGLLWGIVQVVR